MSYRRWIKLVLSFITAPVLIVTLINYIVDPFSIFHSNIMHYDFELNERFNKTRHIDKHHDQYNSYILGSSRMGTTSPYMLEFYIPGSRFYNFTAAGSTQYDNELLLKYLLKKNYPIKNLYLQIDLSDVYGYEPPKSNYNAKHHPHVTNSSSALFYISYLSILPVNHLVQKIKVNYFEKHKSYLRHDITHSGRWYADHLEAKITKDHEQYIREELSFLSKPIVKANKGTKILENITSLQNIKKLVDAHNIRLIVFITPHHSTMLETIDIESYLKYLYEIAQITNFWDFSGYNSVTLDHHYYYENSHYRERVSELIAKKIFHDNNVYSQQMNSRVGAQPPSNRRSVCKIHEDCEVGAGNNLEDSSAKGIPMPPSDFGHYVTPQNLRSHLSTKEHRAISHQEIKLARNCSHCSQERSPLTKRE